ncbi:MAG: hypothetical protein WKF82_05875 [Nocardioidaceae bacterium]
MRISWRGAGVTLTAATMLVVGVDYATFASTGNSLILGEFNTAEKTTTLVKNGVGPALRLTTMGNEKPSLAVSSPARVRRLNADKLDGQTAWTLASRAVTYRGGSRGVVCPGGAYWPLAIKPGIYQASFKAFVIPQDLAPGTTSVDVICGLANLNTLGPRTHVYAADSATYSGQSPNLLSGAETVRIGASANPGMLCVIPSNEDFQLGGRVTSSWTPVNHLKIEVVQALPSSAVARQGLAQQFHP